MYQRILVAVDGSDPSNDALEEAIKLAKEQHASLRIVHVIDLRSIYEAVSSGVPIQHIEEAIVQRGEAELNRSATLARNAGVTAEIVLHRARSRRISAEIVDEAKRWPADLIVLGTHGRHGLERLVLGSVAEGVARIASVPVLLVRRG